MVYHCSIAVDGTTKLACGTAILPLKTQTAGPAPHVFEGQDVVDEAIYQEYYETFARGYTDMLNAAARKGEIRAGNNQHRAWALMGMSHFLGLKYALWDQRAKQGDGAFDPIVETISDLFHNGLALNGRDRG